MYIAQRMKSKIRAAWLARCVNMGVFNLKFLI